MTSLRKTMAAAASLLAAALLAAATAIADSSPRIEVTEAKLRIDLGDGRILQGADLLGIILHLRNRAGDPIELRIDSVETPMGDAMSGIELYGFSRRDGTGGWSPLCKPGADGRALGFPLPGATVPDGDGEAAGNGFSITCTAGARGKCVMLGYRPWAASGGKSLRPYFESCVRMMRADYCGDGASHTEPGVRIDMWDSAGVQQSQTDLPFEAAWGPDGALCLAHARAPGVATIDAVLARCPRLAAHAAADCESWSRRSDSGALIWNRSAIND